MSIPSLRSAKGDQGVDLGIPQGLTHGPVLPPPSRTSFALGKEVSRPKVGCKGGTEESGLEHGVLMVRAGLSRAGPYKCHTEEQRRVVNPHITQSVTGSDLLSRLLDTW